MSNEGTRKIPLTAKLGYVGTGVVIGLAASPLVRKALDRTRPSWSGLVEGLTSKAEHFADRASDLLAKAREGLIQAEQEWHAQVRASAARQEAADESVSSARFEYDESTVIFDDASVTEIYDPTEMAPESMAAAGTAKRKGAEAARKRTTKARAKRDTGASSTKERAPKRKTASRRRSKGTALS